VPPLASCSASLRAAVDGVGRESGELWLHLIGLALESPAGAEQLVGRLRAIDADDLRRHLVGAHVPAWRTAVGAEALEHAAAGDTDAARRLLADECYYGGQARNALTRVLPMTADETKARVVEVVARFADEVLAPREEELLPRLRGAVDAAGALVDRDDPEGSVTAITAGYAYEREAELKRVVLVPHLAAPPWLLLMQHDDARIIGYPARAADDRDRLVRLGRALADEKRVEILSDLARGEATLNELTARTGLAKSTVHHHLAQLREAGLVSIRGNARGYWYSLSVDGAAAGVELVRAALTDHTAR
jgi:DNA-binding transcriptional ArsR family regulator